MLRSVGGFHSQIAHTADYICRSRTSVTALHSVRVGVGVGVGVGVLIGVLKSQHRHYNPLVDVCRFWLILLFFFLFEILF